MMFTCVALQNMLLEFDNASQRLTSWEVDAGFVGSADAGFVDGDEDEDEGRLWCRPTLRRSRKKKDRFIPQATDDFSDFGMSSIPIGVKLHIGEDDLRPDNEEKIRHDAKQRMLVEHFKHVHASGRVEWLRSAS
mmetsp:Transcript_43550/g.118307  ORF Transcript_43550/g.118307 Transcript_43550/m.118307 type:complete len:134 (-) Transcript_43550:63-464(-)